MHKFLIAILLITSCAPVHGQYPPPHVSFFASRNVAKIAQRLTSNSHSNSEKVYAIHYWITHHIKYDVNKFLTYNFQPVSIKKILHNRTAICVGYCDLFNALCACCSIKSVTVQGYTKNSFTDLGDKSYLDDHVWNAVEINNKWRLIDNTWDAGYIIFNKVTFFSKVLHSISFGKIDLKSVYHPYFVQAPTEKYYSKTGRFFKTDHWPLNPIWQIMPGKPNITFFEKDSSYYFNRYDNSIDSNSYNQYAEQQDDYYNYDDRKKTFANGFNGHQSNLKYNLGLAENWNVMAHAKWDTLNTTLELEKQQRLDCDTVLMQIDSSLHYYRQNDSLLHVQKNELTCNNDLKKLLFKKSSGRMMLSEKRVKTSMITNEGILRSASNFLFSNIRANNGRQRRILNERFSKSIPHYKSDRIKDSLEIRKQLLVVCDSLTKLNALLKNCYQQADTSYSYVTHHIDLYLSHKHKLDNAESYIIGARFFFCDDLDLPVVSIRDTLVPSKLKNDSLMLKNDTSLIRYYSNSLKYTIRVYNRLFHSQWKKIQLCRRLKLLSPYHAVADTIYNNAISSALAALSTQNKWNKSITVQTKNLNLTCIAMYKNCKRNLKAYNFERDLEYQNSRARLRNINNRLIAYLGVNNASMYSVIKLKTIAVNLKSKLLSSLMKVR